MYRADEMTTIIDNAQGRSDTYQSQAFFARGRRLADRAAAFTHAWIDCDIYKSPVHLDPGTNGSTIIAFCHQQDIPPPSLIIDSGRGVYLKWLFTGIIPGKAAPKLVRVNKELVKKFKAWCSDPAAVDAARILRVVGSINSKSGRPVRIIADTGHRYDFDSLSDAVLPMTKAALAAARETLAAKAVASSAEREKLVSISRERARRDGDCAPNKKSPRSWQWAVIDDLRTLARIRWGGMVPEGHRSIFGHIGASMLGHIYETQPDRLWAEIQTFAALLLPAGYRQKDLQAHSSTLLKRIEKGDGSYRYKAATIIDKLDIQDAEMDELKVLISSEEKAYRRNRARRQGGRSDRPNGTTGHDRRGWRVEVAAGSAELEKPWEHQGISRATWYRHKAAGTVKKLPKSKRTVSNRTRLMVMGRAHDKAAFREFTSHQRSHWQDRIREAEAQGWGSDALGNLEMAMRADLARSIEYYRAGEEGRAVQRRKSSRKGVKAPAFVIDQNPPPSPEEIREHQEQIEDMEAILAAWAA